MYGRSAVPANTASVETRRYRAPGAVEPDYALYAKAMDLCLTGRLMDAQEAEHCGLVSRICPADRLLEAVTSRRRGQRFPLAKAAEAHAAVAGRGTVGKTVLVP